jgi:hypothetical protein
MTGHSEQSVDPFHSRTLNTVGVAIIDEPDEEPEAVNPFAGTSPRTPPGPTPGPHTAPSRYARGLVGLSGQKIREPA